MERPETHRIADDLRETWLEEFAAEGVAELEGLLAKHARFNTFLEENGRDGPV